MRLTTIIPAIFFLLSFLSIAVAIDAPSGVILATKADLSDSSTQVNSSAGDLGGLGERLKSIVMRFKLDKQAASSLSSVSVSEVTATNEDEVVH